LTQSPNDKMQESYGPGFFDALKQVQAPDGSADKISSPDQLWARAANSNDLTPAGIHELTSLMKMPKDESDSLKLFYTGVHDQISGKDAWFGMKDPRGDELELNARLALDRAYQDGRAKGLSPAALLSSDSKDYIGGIIGTYKRTPAQQIADLNAANKATMPAAKTDAGPAFDLNTPAGIRAAYQAGKMTRDQASALLVSKGFAKPAAAPAPSMVPVN
jgi:hypothetical protein